MLLKFKVLNIKELNIRNFKYFTPIYTSTDFRTVTVNGSSRAGVFEGEGCRYHLFFFLIGYFV